MAILPSLCTVIAILGLATGIAIKCVFTMVASALLLLLVLPALCLQIYELTPAYYRKHQQEMEDFNDALRCIEDLEALSKNKTKENIAQFKSKWPNFVQRITSSDLICRIAYDKGVWKLFNEISKAE